MRFLIFLEDKIYAQIGYRNSQSLLVPVLCGHERY